MVLALGITWPLWYPVVREIVLDILEAADTGGARGESSMVDGRSGRTPHRGARKRWVNPTWDSGRRAVTRGGPRRTGYAREARPTLGRISGFREPGT